MHLSFILKNYGHFFYLIGQSTFDPLAKTCHKHRKLFFLRYFTYFAIYFTIVLVLTATGLAMEFYALTSVLRNEGSPNLVIGIVVTACSNFAAILQCKLYPNSVEAIHQIFSQVDHILRKNLHRTIFYEPYRNVYRVKFYVLVFLFLIDFIVAIIMNAIFDRELPVTGIGLFLMCISVLSHLHALFYIGLHVFVQEKFRKIIASVCGTKNIRNGEKEDAMFSRSRNSRQIVTKIQTYKIVHFKLWIASQKISEYFGWQIVIFYLQNFLHMTKSAFYIYMFAQDRQLAEAGIMRMYRIMNTTIG